MKAVVYENYGLPDVLQFKEVEKPVPEDDEVLVKIYATTVSSGDCRLRRADPFVVRFYNGLTKPRRMNILGNELAGEIEEVGKKVKEYSKGDLVLGQAGNLGANAEYISLTEDEVVKKPEFLTFEEAAVIPFGGNTAYHFLDKGNIRRGQKVLIYGASGSVGTAAVQIAKHFGTEVTGVCSTENLALVESLGADKVIDYTKDKIVGNSDNYDIIFDTVGKSPFSECMQSLVENGIYLRAVHMALPTIIRGVWTTMTTDKEVIGGVATERKENLLFLKELIEAGEFKPVIDRSYPLEQIAEAHRYVDKGHKKGNVVITVVG